MTPQVAQLLDEQFIKDYFRKRVLPSYPEAVKIHSIIIRPIKKDIWEHSYRVVIEYAITFTLKNGGKHTALIFCSAHTHEQRKNVYDALNFLWNKGFARGHLTIPRPLFYSQRFKGVFYRGLKGKNLYQYMRENKFTEALHITLLAARWFAKLHRVATTDAHNFNKKNSRIETIVPGARHWLESIRTRHSEYFLATKKIYEHLNKKEKDFLRSTPQRWLIHGDAHPENVIQISAHKIGVIDFTDMCLADRARDVGSFMQQIHYMLVRHVPAKQQHIIRELQDAFLNEYLRAAGLEMTPALQKRIINYYRWTALRTAIFFLTKEHPEPSRAGEILTELEQEMALPKM